MERLMRNETNLIIKRDPERIGIDAVSAKSKPFGDPARRRIGSFFRLRYGIHRDFLILVSLHYTEK
jgi:hypothetical protein